MGEAPQRMSFADLARPLLPRLYALSRRLVDDDAEDLVQECLLKVVVRHPSTKSDVPALARMLGHTVEHEHDADGVLRLIVRTKRG